MSLACRGDVKDLLSTRHASLLSYTYFSPQHLLLNMKFTAVLLAAFATGLVS